jgi:hypothetical protein
VVVVLFAERVTVVGPASVVAPASVVKLVPGGADVTIVTTAPGIVVVVTLATVVLVLNLGFSGHQVGSLTGVRNTIMHTTPARQAKAMASALPLCCRAANRANKKKALSRKKRAMLTELRTRPAYQNSPRPGIRQAYARAAVAAPKVALTAVFTPNRVVLRAASEMTGSHGRYVAAIETAPNQTGGWRCPLRHGRFYS